MAKAPTTKDSAAEQQVPNSTQNSGFQPQIFEACAAAYPALPKNIACPNDNNPPKPSNKLKAQANSAKHMTFIKNMGYTHNGAIEKIATMKANTTHKWAWDLAAAGDKALVFMVFISASQTSLQA